MSLIHKKVAEKIREYQNNPAMTKERLVHSINGDIAICAKNGREWDRRTLEEIRKVVKEL